MKSRGNWNFITGKFYSLVLRITTVSSYKGVGRILSFICRRRAKTWLNVPNVLNKGVSCKITY